MTNKSIPRQGHDVPPAMIYHHPGEIFLTAKAGSQVRPAAMLKAFKRLGYDVIEVVGTSAQRKAAIRHIDAELRRGRVFDFVYSESRSIPTLLTDPDRIPRAPCLDFDFFARMRQAGIPVGLYYRDLNWRFPHYRTMLPWYGRLVTRPLYRYDWWQYTRNVDHLFLPSQPIETYLPSRHFAGHCSALPPGVSLPESDGVTTVASSATPIPPLRMLYVGGVTPPVYDLTPMFEAVRQTAQVELTLCCRPAEWERIRSFYAPFLTERVHVVHRAGDELNALYRNHHIVGILWNLAEYLEVGTPVKLFETLGQALPVITTGKTEAARIVAAESMGWVADDVPAAVATLQRLIQSPQLIAECRAHMMELRHQHTWEKRAEEVVAVLGAYRARSLPER